MKRIVTWLVAASLLVPAAAAAHDHWVMTGNGDIVYIGNHNGSHNAPFQDLDGNWIICGGDPAWYGHEVAHHGPDASGRGQSDGCFMIEGGEHPALHDDPNPAIE